MTSETIRIGTRSSALALWQAEFVQNQLNDLGYSTEIVPISSEGDLNLTQPIYQMGLTGVFTKTLDAALLTKQIDIAVHSMKDVPTQLAEGIAPYAVLKRGDHRDVLVLNPKKEQSLIIGTGSLRRKAQWLRKNPNYQVENLRGNIQRRIQKLEESSWEGAIFAQAGLERMNMAGHQLVNLDYMIPAPAQGALLIVGLKEQLEKFKGVTNLNHSDTALCTSVERDFLKTLEGGCSSPVGAYAFVDKDTLCFKGGLYSLNGQEAIEVEREIPLSQAAQIGCDLAQEIRNNGGIELLKAIQDEKDH
jgi:hydroxymethylbilane synthase